MDRQRSTRTRWRSVSIWLSSVLTLLIAGNFAVGQFSSAAAATPVTAGYKDFSFGSTTDPAITGEKPESKLWWNDGFWWGSLFNTTDKKFHIYKLNLNTQNWEDQNTPLDDRDTTKADVLWDQPNQKLYVVSHIFVDQGVADTNQANWGRLYRYSYANGAYTLDSGFPVTVTQGKSETLVLAKDSTGMLWVTYVQNSKVMINHSIGSDSSWGTPTQLPVSGSSVGSDDISSIVAFGGNQIGMMWSNHPSGATNTKMYFAAHTDGTSDTSWSVIAAYAPGGAAADDHINLKSVQSDGTGKIFAVVKTSFNDTGSSSDPLIVVLACTSGGSCTSPGSWQFPVVYYVRDGAYTRPILLIDTDNNQLHVFAANPDSGTPKAIYHKVANISSLTFPTGSGDPFIKSITDTDINNPTSTKQNVNRTTGLVVLASDSTSKWYLHNYLSLGGPPPATATTTPSATPSPTPTGSPSPTITPNPLLKKRVYLPEVVR